MQHRPGPQRGRGPAARSTHRRRVAIALILLALAGYVFANIGRFLTKEDPIQHADAIAVLAGTRMDRALEAADLYRRGFAAHIIVTRQTPEPSFATLAKQGIALPADAEVTEEVLQKLGVPKSAIIVPAAIHDNTAQEARTFRGLAAANGWHTLIVVTSKYHLRRAGFAVRRELAGTGVVVMMHGTHYDNANPDRWWTSRSDWRWVVGETGKLIVYELGLGA